MQFDPTALAAIAQMAAVDYRVPGTRYDTIMTELERGDDPHEVALRHHTELDVIEVHQKALAGTLCTLNKGEAFHRGCNDGTGNQRAAHQRAGQTGGGLDRAARGEQRAQEASGRRGEGAQRERRQGPVREKAVDGRTRARRQAGEVQKRLQDAQGGAGVRGADRHDLLSDGGHRRLAPAEVTAMAASTERLDAAIARLDATIARLTETLKRLEESRDKLKEV